MLPFLCFFIAQRAVKSWIAENCLEKLIFGPDNKNVIDLICFIDFLSKIFHHKNRKNLVFKFKKKVLFIIIIIIVSRHITLYMLKLHD